MHTCEPEGGAGMNIPAWGKSAYKKTVPHFPGYHALCLAVRRARPPDWQWVERLPVKPGILVPVQSSVGEFYMTRPERCSIAKKFFWTGGTREPAEDRLALDLFAAMARHSDVILDIGCNSGLFSLVAARANADAKVLAFDILPEALHILLDNLIINGLSHRVEFQLAGIGKQGIFKAPFNSISSEMPSSLSLELPQRTGNGVEVPVRALDDVCLPHSRGKKLAVKIDVEGTEVDIFDQGQRTFEECRPALICEVLPSGRDVARYDALLALWSYRKFLITDCGLRQQAHIEPHLHFRDWLLLPEGDDFGVTPFLK